jgi:hypothetical protein
MPTETETTYTSSRRRRPISFLFAIWWYRGLGFSLSVEMTAFLSWCSAIRPDLLKDTHDGAQVRHVVAELKKSGPAMRSLSRAEKLQFGARVLACLKQGN